MSPQYNTNFIIQFNLSMGSNPGKPQGQPNPQKTIENPVPPQEKPIQQNIQKIQQPQPIITEEVKAPVIQHSDIQKVETIQNAPQQTSNPPIKQEAPDPLEDLRPPSQTQKEYDDQPKDFLCDPPVPASVQQLNQEMASIVMTKPLIPDIESKIKNQRSHLQFRVLSKNGKFEAILLRSLQGLIF